MATITQAAPALLHPEDIEAQRAEEELKINILLRLSPPTTRLWFRKFRFSGRSEDRTIHSNATLPVDQRNGHGNVEGQTKLWDSRRIFNRLGSLSHAPCESTSKNRPAETIASRHDQVIQHGSSSGGAASPESCDANDSATTPSVREDLLHIPGDKATDANHEQPQDKTPQQLVVYPSSDSQGPSRTGVSPVIPARPEVPRTSNIDDSLAEECPEIQQMHHMDQTPVQTIHPKNTIKFQQSAKMGWQGKKKVSVTSLSPIA